MVHDPRLIPSMVGGRYVITHKLGSGSFGQVYAAAHHRTGSDVAVKVVQILSGKSDVFAREVQITRRLQGSEGFVQVHYTCVSGEYGAMVTDLLGPSLEEVFSITDRRCPSTVLSELGLQMLDRLQIMSEFGVVHRDVKPANFAIGRCSRRGMVYLIDFGLAKQYYCRKADRHIPYSKDNGFTGTPLFASINAHLGNEQSRRDDLQALGYTLLYLLRGDLPWQTFKSKRKILELKQTLSPETLCKGHPYGFGEFLAYSSRLRFQDTPDYSLLRRILRSLSNGYVLNEWLDVGHFQCKMDSPALPSNNVPDSGAETKPFVGSQMSEDVAHDEAAAENHSQCTSPDLDEIVQTARHRIIRSL